MSFQEPRLFNASEVALELKGVGSALELDGVGGIRGDRDVHFFFG